MTSSKLIPDHRPRIDPDEIEAVIADMMRADTRCNSDILMERSPVLMFGHRGHFPNSLGRKNANDLGYYDDAILIRRAARDFITFNANVDPSRAGHNPGVGKNYAQLDADQIVVARQGRHKKTPMRIRQMNDEEAEDAQLEDIFPDGPDGERDYRADGEYRIQRITADGVGEFDTGCYNINWHGGGHFGTSSWGCQTIPPEQEAEFFTTIYELMNKNGQTWDPARKLYGIIGYFLTDRKLKK